eukprot:scaffold13094_cov23-Cyclotella_meneghiniana.AAC.1
MFDVRDDDVDGKDRRIRGGGEEKIGQRQRQAEVVIWQRMAIPMKHKVFVLAIIHGVIYDSAEGFSGNGMIATRSRLQMKM